MGTQRAWKRCFSYWIQIEQAFFDSLDQSIVYNHISIWWNNAAMYCRLDFSFNRPFERILREDGLFELNSIWLNWALCVQTFVSPDAEHETIFKYKQSSSKTTKLAKIGPSWAWTKYYLVFRSKKHILSRRGNHFWGEISNICSKMWYCLVWAHNGSFILASVWSANRNLRRNLKLTHSGPEYFYRHNRGIWKMN